MIHRCVESFVVKLIADQDDINLLFNQFVDVSSHGSLIKCLASNDLECDEKFENSISKNNLIWIFNHLYERHRSIYDYITADIRSWCNEQNAKYKPILSISTINLQTAEDVETLFETMYSTTKKPTLTLTRVS
ncbi:unnamed protein product [Rotaria socialis]